MRDAVERDGNGRMLLLVRALAIWGDYVVSFKHSATPLHSAGERRSPTVDHHLELHLALAAVVCPRIDFLLVAY